jgi:uncharacterized OsmC-like protein
VLLSVGCCEASEVVVIAADNNHPLASLLAHLARKFQEEALAETSRIRFQCGLLRNIRYD